MTENRSVGHSLWPPSRKQVIQAVIGLLVSMVLVLWWLPQMAHTTWGAVFDTLIHVGLTPALLLYVLMCLGLWSYTLTLAGSLPGLGHLKALIVNLCGSSAGNFVPGGGAAGVAVTYAACRSWGFSRRDISTSIIVTGFWNILARMILPVTGLIALLVAGGDLPVAVVRGGVIGAAAGLVLLAIFISGLASEKAASTIGKATDRVLRALLRWLRSTREVAFDKVITDQRAHIVGVVRHGWLRMTFGLVGYFAVFYVIFWQSMHVVGVRMTFSHMFAAYAVGRLLSAIGITPGGVGVTEGGAVAVLIAFGADPALALSGTVLFSLYTHVMEVPLGALAYVGWAVSKKTEPTDGSPRSDDTSRGG